MTYALVGGRRGVARHRAGVERDEQRFIPLYRRTLQTLLATTPAGPRLMRLVDRAIEHDHQENANLLAAFDLLDPPAPARPRVLSATRHTAPAAAHAVVKLALLAAPVIAAAETAFLRRAPLGPLRSTTDGPVVLHDQPDEPKTASGALA